MNEGWTGPLELPFSGDVGWEVAKAPEPPRKRVTRGLRLASLRAAQPAEADSSAMDGGWKDWGAAVADGDASDGGAAATAGGANGSSYGFERLPGAQAPWQRAEATMRQQKWTVCAAACTAGMWSSSQPSMPFAVKPMQPIAKACRSAWLLCSLAAAAVAARTCS